MGGTLARYSDEGIETSLITATRGERGRFGRREASPDPELVGRTRERELRAAAKELGIAEVNLLGFMDGDLDQVNPQKAISKIAFHLRRIRPNVVLTFGPEGGYGHPDHIAISQFTTAATICAADPEFRLIGEAEWELPVHRVSKLYYMAWSGRKWGAYQAALRTLKARVDGIERQATPWPDWAVTTLIDTSDYWATVWRAVSCHETQMAIYEKLKDLPEKHHQALWGSQEYYRAFSVVNGGRQCETDLFEGLR
jgi:LmbE family N-acetylglucosaminyl deacetylase